MEEEVLCYHCGYKWTYRGSSDLFATCPGCKSRVTLRLSRAHQDRGVVMRLERAPQCIRVECPTCGHTWRYHGLNPHSTACLACKRTIRFAAAREGHDGLLAGPVREVCSRCDPSAVVGLSVAGSVSVAEKRRAPAFVPEVLAGRPLLRS